MTARKTDPRNMYLQAQRDMRIEKGEMASNDTATAFMAKVLARIGYRGMKESSLEELAKHYDDDAYSGKRLSPLIAPNPEMTKE